MRLHSMSIANLVALVPVMFLYVTPLTATADFCIGKISNEIDKSRNWQHSASYLFRAGLARDAIELIDDDGIPRVIHHDIPEGDISGVPSPTLRVFFSVSVNQLAPHSGCVTCQVLIRTPLVVPVSRAVSTTMPETVSSAPSFPRLPMLTIPVRTVYT